MPFQYLQSYSCGIHHFKGFMLCYTKSLTICAVTCCARGSHNIVIITFHISWTLHTVTGLIA